MADDLTALLAALKPVLGGCAKKLRVTADAEDRYVLETKRPSPFPQHKGKPLFFAALKLGKSHVSLHLMPLYMSESLNGRVTGELKKRLKGKTCFHFRNAPAKETARELRDLVKASLADWEEKGWV